MYLFALVMKVGKDAGWERTRTETAAAHSPVLAPALADRIAIKGWGAKISSSSKAPQHQRKSRTQDMGTHSLALAFSHSCNLPYIPFFIPKHKRNCKSSSWEAVFSAC